MGALGLLVMIIWENLQDLSEEKKECIRICEQCEYLGEFKNCTEHECGCFVTSIVIEGLGCPHNKW
jgi:hypothetical protein